MYFIINLSCIPQMKRQKDCSWWISPRRLLTKREKRLHRKERMRKEEIGLLSLLLKTQMRNGNVSFIYF